MKMRLASTAAALAIIAASPSLAFEHNRTEFSLGYQDLSYFGTGFYGTDARVQSDFSLSPSWGVQGDLEYSDTNSGFFSVYRPTYGLHVYNELSDELRIGAFVQQSNYTISGFPVSLDISYYGVEAMLTPLPNLSIEAYYGLGQYDVGGGTSLDMTTFGSQVSYGITPEFALRIASDFDTIDTGGFDYQISSYAIGADYYMNGGLPMIFSAEVGNAGYGGISIDRAEIRLTIPLGGGGDSGARKLFGIRGATANNLIPVT